MINYFKGVIAGIGNITPGVSGSAMLIIFGLYEKCIIAISNIFKEFKKSLLFLLPIGFGIVIGTVAFSKVIKFLLQTFPMQTTFVFTGFVAGTIPYIFKKATNNKFKWIYLLPLIITFSIGLLLMFIPEKSSVSTIDMNLINFIKLIFVGFLIAASTIIPGISSTILLMLIGMYDIYLNALSTINIIILIPIVIGLGVGGFILSKLIAYLLKRFHDLTFYAILGFLIGTILELPRGSVGFNITSILSIILGLLAFVFSLSIEKIVTKIEKK